MQSKWPTQGKGGGGGGGGGGGRMHDPLSHICTGEQH